MCIAVRKRMDAIDGDMMKHLTWDLCKYKSDTYSTQGHKTHTMSTRSRVEPSLHSFTARIPFRSVVDVHTRTVPSRP